MSLVEMLAEVRPHAVAIGLISCRLLPVAYLSPLFGGTRVPAHVRLGVALSLSLFLHHAAGIAAADAWTAVASAAPRELALGLVMGLAVESPFIALRLAGQLNDDLRATSAEAFGWFGMDREGPTARLVYGFAVAWLVVGWGWPIAQAALFGTFTSLPLGTWRLDELGVVAAAHVVGRSFVTGMALAMPLLLASLGGLFVLAVTGRASPSLNFADVALPVRLVAGFAVLAWLLPYLAERIDAILLEIPLSFLAFWTQ